MTSRAHTTTLLALTALTTTFGVGLFAVYLLGVQRGLIQAPSDWGAPSPAMTQLSAHHLISAGILVAGAWLVRSDRHQAGWALMSSTPLVSIAWMERFSRGDAYHLWPLTLLLLVPVTVMVVCLAVDTWKR